jgi:fatty-acyl-CoA synthase
VPRDGQTVGEILLTGNNVTIGYYRDPHGSEVAFSGGWFHSGDLGVHHADGVIELTDRKKDIIITGGENVSTIELESVITQHEAVQEVAVVGVPDDYWGEHPHVFVVLRPSATLTLTDLQAFMRDRVTSYKLPRGLTVCDDLPRTATGKIQKFLLKQMVK